ncbi:MAG TPA: phage holin family protein [Actinomycetes bacterium]|nr:phage holin family protein [Actinomycetes bacterium]
MTTTDQRAESDERPTLGALVAMITRELSLLVRGEIDLAKAEMKRSARNGALGGGLLAAAAALLVMVGLLVTWAAVYGLAAGTGLPLWGSFLIVAGFYLIIAVVLGLVGVLSLKKAKGPEQAVAEMQRTKEILQGVVPASAPPPNP